MKWQSLAILLFLTTNIFFFDFAFALEDFELNFYKDYQKVFYTNVYYFPSTSKDSIEVMIFYRYSANYLSFERLNPKSEMLRGIGFVDVVIRDSIGVIQKALSRFDTISVPEQSKAIGETNEVFGFLSTKLKIYNYNLEITLFDKGNTKLKTLKIPLKQHRVGNFLVLNPINSVKDSNIYKVEVMGNALNFASKDKCIIVGIVSYSNVVDFIQYKIESLNEKTSKLQWRNKVNLEGKANVISSTFPNLHFARNEIGVSFDSKASTGETSSDILFFEIPIPENLAFPQKYSLTLLINGSKKNTVSFEFEIFWDKPPFSLRNLNYATDLAYYILTDEEFEELKDAKKEEQERKFFDLWRKFDTDTTTLFNEAMAVYYNRVDYAFFNYQSINEPDGAKTERGKIYILYGKPTSTSREIDKDDVVREIWYYDRLHKKFIFSSKDGKFVLESITNL